MRARFAALTLPALVVLVAFACGEHVDEQKTGSSDASAPTDMPTEVDALAPLDATADAAPRTGLSPMFVHRDVNHVLSTGQSLSVGSGGTPPLSTTQAYANLMFSSGVITGGTGLTALVPLTEGRVPGGTNLDLETMSSGLANLVTKMARDELLVDQEEGKRSHDLLVSVHGVGGTAYAGLKKGTTAFANGMAQTKAAFDLAKSLGKSYVARAVTNVHGESDHVLNNPSYAQNLAEWQADYEAGVKAVTGQSDPVPMFHTQMSSWTRYDTATSAIPQAQLAASRASGGRVVLVGPKYHLAYTADGVHLSSDGYRQMGEDYAKAYRRVILEGKAWEPVRPLSISRAGATVTVKFVVPAPPLVLDETLVTNPGNFGFEVAQTGAPSPTITGVAVTGPDTVTITLSAEPTGESKRLRYAFTGVVGALGGPKTGPRGNLRDSDPTPSRNGYALYNWCVHFDEAMP